MEVMELICEKTPEENPLPVIALDLGGVLLSDGTKTAFARMGCLSRRATGEELGHLWQTRLRVPAEVGEISSDEVFDRLSVASGIPRKRVTSTMLDEFRELPEGVTFVRNAVRQGTRMVLATNHLAEWLTVWTERYDWFTAFDHVVCSSDIGKRKPDALFFAAMRDAADVNGPVPFVDDDPVNVAAACSSGLRGLLSTSGWSRALSFRWEKDPSFPFPSSK